jgi:uncharacterized protein YcfJ
MAAKVARKFGDVDERNECLLTFAVYCKSMAYNKWVGTVIGGLAGGVIGAIFGFAL